VAQLGGNANPTRFRASVWVALLSGHFGCSVCQKVWTQTIVRLSVKEEVGEIMATITRSMKRFGFAVVAAAAMAIPAISSAATIVDWKPGPTSAGIPEFSWTGNQLVGAAGITSNGDGQIARANQTAPGLDMETPFVINGVPGSVVDPVQGTTLFYDASIAITGFVASGPAVIFGPTIIQQLGPGDFTLKSTTGVLLLHGTVQASTITGNNGSQAGAVFSANDVNYDSGLIFNAMTASGQYALTNNDFSFSFANISPNVTFSNNSILPFTTDATGLYQADLVPEPATLGMLLVGGLATLRRRRA
jgi:hypothetical protein